MKQQHRYENCHDEDCERLACRAWREGYSEGYDEGFTDGVASGSGGGGQ